MALCGLWGVARWQLCFRGCRAHACSSLFAFSCDVLAWQRGQGSGIVVVALLPRKAALMLCSRLTHAAAPAAACLRQVDEVKNIMVDNIEKVLERGEKIELLVDKTDNLRFQVGQGRAGGRAPCTGQAGRALCSVG